MWVLLDMITALDMIQVVKEIFRTHHLGAPHLYLFAWTIIKGGAK